MICIFVTISGLCTIGDDAIGTKVATITAMIICILSFFMRKKYSSPYVKCFFGRMYEIIGSFLKLLFNDIECDEVTSEEMDEFKKTWLGKYM